MKILCSVLISIALVANASAQTAKSKSNASAQKAKSNASAQKSKSNVPPPTGKSKIECTASGGVTINVDIDYDSRIVRVQENNGPIRRGSVKIGKETVSWLVVNSVGSTSNRTTYTMDRKSKTLSVVPDRGRRLDSTCNA